MGPCCTPAALLGTPRLSNRWRAGVPPLLTPPLQRRRRPALAARPQAELGRPEQPGVAKATSGHESSSSAAAADGGLGQAAPDLPRTSGSDDLGTSERSSSGDGWDVTSASAPLVSSSSSSRSSSNADASTAGLAAGTSSFSAEAGGSGAPASGTAASGAADEAAPAGGAASSSSSSSSEGGFKASMLFQGGGLDWQALRSLQPPQAQPPPPPQQQAPGDAAVAALEPAAGRPSAAHIGTLWGLLVLSLAYLHHSTSGFALPALLPIISEDMKLSDTQGALLTAGYTVLYALALVPVGLLADRTDRPRLLAGGIALWSLLTMAASETRSFGQLLAMRVGFAAAQATQNPICFSLIPELFPKNRTTAMAVYNTAIYAGRALSFAALILAGQLGVPQVGPSALGELGISTYTLVPLDKVDLSLVSVLYTQGDYAAVTPVYTYAMDDDAGVPIESAFSAWRPLLFWLGPPGLAMAALALLTVEEPRQRGRSGRFMPLMTLSKDSIDEEDLNTPIGQLGQPAGGPGAAAAPAAEPREAKPLMGARAAAAAVGLAAPPPPAPAPGAAAAAVALPAGTLVSAPEQAAPASVGESLVRMRGLVADPAFLALTLSAALNDVGSWALVSWQATFYQRVYELEPSTYAPLLAVVIPVGGIIGGVGAGVFGDWLNRLGMRGWLTAGSCIVAAPLIAVSLLVPDYKQSFAALLVGFALSECWRAPAAVMVREVSPPGLGSTASAMHLCIRNLVGGMGPIGVALLSSKVGLQMAMLLIPACYVASGLGLAVTEGVIKAERERRHAEAVALLHEAPTEPGS